MFDMAHRSEERHQIIMQRGARELKGPTNHVPSVPSLKGQVVTSKLRSDRGTNRRVLGFRDGRAYRRSASRPAMATLLAAPFRIVVRNHATAECDLAALRLLGQLRAWKAVDNRHDLNSPAPRT